MISAYNILDKKGEESKHLPETSFASSSDMKTTTYVMGLISSRIKDGQ